MVYVDVCGDSKAIEGKVAHTAGERRATVPPFVIDVDREPVHCAGYGDDGLFQGNRGRYGDEAPQPGRSQGETGVAVVSCDEAIGADSGEDPGRKGSVSKASVCDLVHATWYGSSRGGCYG